MLPVGSCGAFGVLRLLLMVLCAGVGVAGACAGEPAAVVEETSDAAGGPPPMAYLNEGTQLVLGSGTRIVLDYMASCTRETVIGGNVRIGLASSEVTGGRVTRAPMDCGKIALALPYDQSDLSGVAVARAQARSPGSVATHVIFSRAPVFKVDRAGPGALLWIERVDGGAPMVITTMRRRRDGRRGAELDFAQERLSLATPGRYRASAGSRSIVFDAQFDPWMAVWPRIIEF